MTVNMQKTVKCPRCDTGRYTPYGLDLTDDESEAMRQREFPLPPALSRVADIYICSECGQDEAMRDFAGSPPVPPDEWPIEPEAE